MDAEIVERRVVGGLHREAAERALLREQVVDELFHVVARIADAAGLENQELARAGRRCEPAAQRGAQADDDDRAKH